jgi:hypothetical protein
VLAGRGGRHRLGMVELVGGAHVDGVDVVASQQLAEFSRRGGDALSLRVGATPLERGAVDAHRLVPYRPQRGEDARGGDVTCPDESPAQAVHGRTLPQQHGPSAPSLTVSTPGAPRAPTAPESA